MNICTEFLEPLSLLCQVIIWTRFGLYILKLKVTVTLTFDGLISKSILLQGSTTLQDKYDEPMSIPCLVNSASSYHPGKVWSVYQYDDSHCDLDL